MIKNITKHLLCRLDHACLTICHVKLTQSRLLEQKRFDLQSLLPTLWNLCLLLVMFNYYSQARMGSKSIAREAEG